MQFQLTRDEGGGGGGRRQCNDNWQLQGGINGDWAVGPLPCWSSFMKLWNLIQLDHQRDRQRPDETHTHTHAVYTAGRQDGWTWWTSVRSSHDSVSTRLTIPTHPPNPTFCTLLGWWWWWWCVGLRSGRNCTRGHNADELTEMRMQVNRMNWLDWTLRFMKRNEAKPLVRPGAY